MKRSKRKDLQKRLRAISAPEHDKHALTRLLRAAGVLFGIFVAGTVGYYFLCDQQYDLLTCAYMTLITLTSIGFGETIPIAGHPDRVVFTIILVILGLGVMLYFVSQLTAFVVDGDLRDMIFLRKMKRDIDQLENHFIVAGLGSTGYHVIKEMLRSDRQCLIIEQDMDIVIQFNQQVSEDLGAEIPYVVGDATDDDTLIEAGIDRAVGIVFALGNDRDNLFATLSARGLNSKIRIITRGENPSSEEKFKRAGATSVIFTDALSGLRMATEVMRPEVTGFLDLMMRDHGEIRRVEELDIPPDSPLIGRTIREANLRRHTDALIVATHDRLTDDYTWNPGPDQKLDRNTKLILLVLVKDIPKIEALLRGRK
jgi:voltage-gated potassium channel